MDQSYEPDQPSGLENLPLDLKVAILKAMPNVPSLISLVLTSSSFYNIFQSHSLPIISEVLSNEIYPELMDHVTYTWLSSRLAERNVVGVHDFLVNYHPHPEDTAGQIAPPKLPPCSMDDALKISALHSEVWYFMYDFCQSTLSAPPISRLRDPSYHMPSRMEVIRIMHVFYYFELYCNLWQRCCPPKNEQPEIDMSDKVTELFFDKFYPWEIEQLGSVHDYLSRKIAPAFEGLVKHDIWAFDTLLFDLGDRRSLYEEECLNEGLKYIRYLSQAKTLNERDLTDSLREHYTSQLLTLPMGLEFTADDGDGLELDFDLSSPPLSVEDPGPYFAWSWAYEDDGGIKRYCADADKKHLREWGYSLWDMDRLEDWHIFDDD